MIHAPDEHGNPVPTAGIGPNARLRWSSRGDAITGVVHATFDTFDTLDGWDRGVTVTALCGRTVRPLVTYDPESWPRMVEQWHRIGRTHETFTCGRCAQRTERNAA